MASYNYSNGDGLAALDPLTPSGSYEYVPALAPAIRQIKAYLKDNIAGPEAKMALLEAQINSLTTDLIPAGLVMPFCGNAAPAGFLKCDGQAVSRTTYARLFALIGITYGPGNGTTTFNLPDYRGRVLVAADNEAGVTPEAQVGANFGNEAGTYMIPESEVPPHHHEFKFWETYEDMVEGDENTMVPLNSTSNYDVPLSPIATSAGSVEVVQYGTVGNPKGYGIMGRDVPYTKEPIGGVGKVFPDSSVVQEPLNYVPPSTTVNCYIIKF